MASIKANCRKVMCIGRNYADHITELNNTRPSKPFFFLKPPSCILPPPHTRTPIHIPRNVSVHYEVELGLVIGPTPSSKPLKNLTFPTSATEASTAAQRLLSSYFVAIDLTGRNVQEQAKKAGLPWTIAKGFDTFLPISQPIDKSQIPDPHDVDLKLSVNGNTKQHDSTSLMLFRIPRILSDVSKVMGLEEGDIILTGTPKGVGRIQAGDVVTCSIEVGGKEVQEGRIEIGVEDAPEGGYVFEEKS